ncbi:MAG: MFS transporter, partial [Tissierellaceae bacterium]
MKLNYRRTILIGLAFMSISAFWQLYDNIIPLILQNNFGLGETLTGGIMALDNILALFMLPLFGSLSDRTRTRLGKRTPFIIGGTALAVAFMMVIPYSARIKSFPLFFVSLGVVLFAMGTYRSPAVALMPDLTPKPYRSSANAVINLMGAVGGITTLILIRLLVPKVDLPDYRDVFLAVSSLMVIAVIILLLAIKENKLSKQLAGTPGFEEDEEDLEGSSSSHEMPKEVKRSLYFILASIFLWFTAYNAVITAFSRYATNVWGLKGGSFVDALMVATGAAILSFIPIGIISSKIGRKKTIIIGIVTMSLSYLSGFFFLEYSPIINVVFAFTGF